MTKGRMRRLVGTHALVIAVGVAVLSADGPAVQAAQSPNPLSGDPEAIEGGMTIYRARCALCHGLSATGGGRGAPNAADLTVFARGYSAFLETVKEGYKTMPAWGGMGALTDTELNQVGAYLESLAKPAADWSDAEGAAGAAGGGKQVAAAETIPPEIAKLREKDADLPGDMSLLGALEAEAEIVRQHAEFANSDLENVENIRLHITHVRHAIDPAQEPEGGPGKGVGLINAARDVRDAMQEVGNDPNASAAAKEKAASIAEAAGNIVGWSEEILSRSGQIVGGASPVASAFFAEEILELTGWILSGADDDGDGIVAGDSDKKGLAQIKQEVGPTKS